MTNDDLMNGVVGGDELDTTDEQAPAEFGFGAAEEDGELSMDGDGGMDGGEEPETY